MGCHGNGGRIDWKRSLLTVFASNWQYSVNPRLKSFARKAALSFEISAVISSVSAKQIFPKHTVSQFQANGEFPDRCGNGSNNLSKKSFLVRCLVTKRPYEFL